MCHMVIGGCKRGVIRMDLIVGALIRNLCFVVMIISFNQGCENGIRIFSNSNELKIFRVSYNRWIFLSSQKVKR
jgi:hypothetical protein